MQRNNHFLKSKRQRPAIALISAIFLLVFISMITALVLGMNVQTQKSTADIYLRDQADLLAKSATEFAMLAISGHERVVNNDCVNFINSQYPAVTPQFDINTTILYIGNGFPANCNMLNGANAITTAESNGTVIIDVYVSATSALQLPEPIRVHRRTIQKP